MSSGSLIVYTLPINQILTFLNRKDFFNRKWTKINHLVGQQTLIYIIYTKLWHTHDVGEKIVTNL